MLCLLAGAMGYSLLSLFVQVIDRSSDRRIAARLSPSGRELIQIRRFGIDVVDAQTGRLLDQVRFIGSWRSALTPDPMHRLATSGKNAWNQLRFHRECSNIWITKSSDIVIAQLFDEGFIWWNRNTGERSLLTAPKTNFITATIDESQNRLYLECAEKPDDPFGKPPPEDAARRVEHLHFDAVRDIRVYELSTGKFLKVIRRLRIGQPVQNQPELRVFAQAGVVDLLKWESFPEGEPKVIQSYRPEEKIYSSLLQPVPELIQVRGTTLVAYRLYGRRYQLAPSSSTETPLQLPIWPQVSQASEEIAGFVGIGYVQHYSPGPVSICVLAGERQVNFESYCDAFRQSSNLSAATISPSQIRIAGNSGAILEFDSGKPQNCRFWSIQLPPYEVLPRDALVVFIAAAISWIAYSLWVRMFLSKQGWLVIMCILGWPVLLWGVERGFSGDPYHAQIASRAIGVSFTLLCVCLVGLFLSKGRSRAVILAPLMLVALLVACAALSYVGREPESFFSLFHTTSVL